MHWMIFLHNAPGHPPKKLNKHYFSIIFHHKLHITTYSFNPCVLNNNVARLQLFQLGCSILISSCLFSDSLNSRWLNFPDFKCKHIFFLNQICAHWKIQISIQIGSAHVHTLIVPKMWPTLFVVCILAHAVFLPLSSFVLFWLISFNRIGNLSSLMFVCILHHITSLK